MVETAPPSASPNLDADPELVQALECVLRRADVRTMPWYMTHRQRWDLLLSVLLGHPLVRGGRRPRDQPMDPESLLAIRTAARLHARLVPPPKEIRNHFRGGTRYRVGDWLVAFAILVHKQGDGAPAGPTRALASQADPHLTAVLRALNQVRLAASLGDKAWRAWEHRLLGLLGVNLQESRRAPDPDIVDLVVSACAAATVCQQSEACAPEPNGDAETQDTIGELSKRYHVSVERLEKLSSCETWEVTLKTAHVQEYIEQGLSHTMMRGASAWCSQALALARDMLTEPADGSAAAMLLVSDSDALVRLRGGQCPSAAILRDHLRELVNEMWRPLAGCSLPPPRLAREFPRLVPFWRLACESGVGAESILPPFRMRVSPPTTLLELCQRRALLSPDEREEQRRLEAAEGRLVELTWPAGSASDRASCVHVRGDTTVIDAPPPWWSDQAAADGDARGRALGWKACVWSLAGTTYRLHVHDGLWAALRPSRTCGWVLDQHDARTAAGAAPCVATAADCRSANDGFTAWVHHGDWLPELGLQKESLTFLKLDGDDVGRRFARVPPLARPTTSLLLAAQVHGRFESGCRAALAALPSSSLRGGRAVPGPLPIDLVYFGGDELLCCLPERLVRPFLEGFHGVEMARTVIESFTGIAVVLPPDPDRRFKGPINHLGAQLVARGLPWAKAHFKHRHADAAAAWNAVEDQLLVNGLEGARLVAAADPESLAAFRCARLVLTLEVSQSDAPRRPTRHALGK